MNEYTTVILFHAITYLPFFFLLWRAKRKSGLRLFDEKGLAANLTVLIELQLAGIFLFGILPFFFKHPGSFVFLKGIDIANPSTWISIFLVIVSIIIAPKILDKKLRTLPVVHLSSLPSAAFSAAYFIIRILFIVAYECWFRGFFLLDSIEGFGIFWAVVLNLCLYAILHIVNGKDEAIASIPYGLLLCALCIWQGAVWPAVVVHLALTIPYELGFVRKLRLIITYPI